MFWYEISHLPTMYIDNRVMFVVKAFNVFPTDTAIFKYTSDPYCVWIENGKFVRWPHPFPPTHYAVLPDEVE